MSRVYIAGHNKLDRKVAVKVLKPALTDQEHILWRFENEALAMDKLRGCPDIINVIDFHEEGNFRAIIMELLEGCTLKDLIKKGAIHEAEVTKIFSKVLNAFSYAHERNVVHRDVKPSNIFLLNSGEIRVLDFGIAKIANSGEESDYTATGTQMGTLIYMSPEQVLDSKHVDHRSDIYSLGVALYHCLKGLPPYNQETLSRFEIQRRIVYEPIEGIQSLTEPYRSIIEKCIAKKPENRFQSCEELNSALLGTLVATEQGTEVQQLQQALIPEIKTGAVPEQQPKCTMENPDGNEKTIIEATSTTPKITAKPQEKSAPTKPKTKKNVILISVAAGVTLLLTLLIWQPWKASDTEALEVSEVSEVSEPEMVYITGGTFTMGSPPSEADRGSDETQHQVTVSDFYMGKYEVTFEQYDAFCDATGRTKPDDAGRGRGTQPVINVSWDDATAYCEWLSGQTGKTYRLPTEAEWEYACRAGTTTPFNTGNCLSTSQANYNGDCPYGSCSKGEYRRKTMPVGSFSANAYGLHNMHGNVWEWCSDWYGDYSTGVQTNPKGAASGSDRVTRGGGWGSSANICRSALRYLNTPDNRENSFGFRLVSPK